MSEPIDLTPDETASARAGEGRRLARASALVAGMGVVWKLIGLARESLVGAIFGANKAMDAFLFARTLPDMFSNWIEAPMRAAIVPLFSKRRHEFGEDEAWRAASNVLNTLAVTLAVFTALLWVAAPLLVRMLATGGDAAQWAESTRFARILAGSVFFTTLAVVLGSLSNVYNRQFVPAMGRNLYALLVLAGVGLLGPTLGLDGYAWGLLAAAVVYFAVQLDIVWRHRRQYRWELRPFAPEVREIVVLGLPLFIGLTGTRIDLLLDRNFASWLPEGSLSVLTYATMLSAIVTDLMLTVAISVLLPHFAQLMAEKRHEELRRRLAQALGGYAFLMVPVTLALTVGSRAVVDVVYARGRFSADAAAQTALLLIVLALADPVQGAGQILAQAHISAGNTRVPMYIGFWRLGVKALLSIALVPTIGVYGLAGASAGSSFIRTYLLWKRLPDETRPCGRDIGAQAASLILPALFGGIVLAIALRAFPLPGGMTGALVRCAILALGGAVYVGVAHARGHWMVGKLRSAVRRG